MRSDPYFKIKTQNVMEAFARGDKKSHLSALAQWRVLSNYLGKTCTVLLHRQGDVTRDHFSATQHCNIMRRCFELLHCSKIATLCYAESRHCESSRVTSPLVLKSGQLIAKLDLRNLLLL